MNNQITDNLKRKDLISFLNKNGFKNLEFIDDEIQTLSIPDIENIKIHEATILFLKSLNIKSGSSTSDFEFYELVSNYIKNPKVRENINDLIRVSK